MEQASNTTNFILDDDFVEQTIQRLPAAPDLNAYPVKLSANQRVGETVPDDYICSICTNFVWQPKQCSECEKLMCKRCIDDWLTKSKTCPTCIQVFQSGKILKVINNYLEASTFNCQKTGCNLNFKYLDATAHLYDHEIPAFKCVLNCSDPNIFLGMEGMRAHLRNTCSKSQLKCRNCNVSKERVQIGADNHICGIEQLKVANQTQSSEIEKLKTVILNQQTELKNQNNEIVQAKTQISQQAAVVKQMQLEAQQHTSLNQQNTAAIQQQAAVIQQMQQQAQQLTYLNQQNSVTIQQQAVMIKQIQDMSLKQQTDLAQPIKELQTYFQLTEGCTVFRNLGIVYPQKLIHYACARYRCYSCGQDCHGSSRHCPNKCHYFCGACCNKCVVNGIHCK